MRFACVLVVGLVVASVCGASGLELTKLVGGDVVAALAKRTEPVTARIVVDATKVAGEATGTVTLVRALGLGLKKAATVAAGQVSELVVADVRLVGGVVAVRLQLLGADKVVLLDLEKLQATLLGNQLTAKVFLVLDEAKKVLHLRNQDGHCLNVDLNVYIIAVDVSV